MYNFLNNNTTDLVQNAKCIISNSITEKHSPHHLMTKVTQLIEDDETNKKFKTCVELLAQRDNTLVLVYIYGLL